MEYNKNINNKSKLTTTKSQLLSSSPFEYLKELDSMIQKHTTLIAKKLSSGENSENFRNESEKISVLKKRILIDLSCINEAKVKSIKEEQEIKIIEISKVLAEFTSELLQVVGSHFLNSLSSDESSFNSLISETNNSLERKYRQLLLKTRFYEELDLKSIKKLQGLYQETANNKSSLTNYLVALTPLQRELSFINESIGIKQLKLLDKENTHKCNSSKAEAYRKELDSTFEKYSKALAVQETCEKDYAQLQSEKSGLEAELQYFIQNLTEKRSKKNRKIFMYKLKDSDEKAKMLNFNNQACLQETENARMHNYDLRASIRLKLSNQVKNQALRQQAQMFLFNIFRFKILQIQFSKVKAEVDKLQQNKFIDELREKVEIIFNLLKKNEQFAEEKAKAHNKHIAVDKRFEKFQRLKESLLLDESKFELKWFDI